MPSHPLTRPLRLGLLAGCIFAVATVPASAQGFGRSAFDRQVADSLGASKYEAQFLAQSVTDAYDAREHDAGYDRAGALYADAADAHNALVDRIGRAIEAGTAVSYDAYASAFDSVRVARQALADHVAGLGEADAVTVTARSGAVVHGIGSMVRSAWHALVSEAREIRGRSASGRGGAGATRGMDLTPEERAQLATAFRDTYRLPGFDTFTPTADASETPGD